MFIAYAGLAASNLATNNKIISVHNFFFAAVTQNGFYFFAALT
jgi:hypothetical protein